MMDTEEARNRFSSESVSKLSGKGTMIGHNPGETLHNY
ncbi:hypothetical protein L21TH_0322 [Caldisalinibacter kiritimatiensis]|uniref:Uncharacterized protein n=1 Tax=Caldisalinibacter kiritimatiensis TaxID=1304284 RepID=R1AWM3_9FIRM|nr:hypothetical protein L21TH_0322 [Caldisalinibacter kiritimatiensis]